MRRISLVALLFFLSLGCGIALEIKGKVTSQDGKPVVEAVVLHRLSQKEALTNSQGFFSIELPEIEKIKLEIIHPDYIEQEIILSRQDISKEIIVRLFPYIRQREEIVVTALRYPESSTSIPAAETVVSKDNLEEKMAPNITEGISNLPGVSALGSGGFSVVPNIRGLSRRRVLILVDNARITSDRRTGPSASFVNPADIEKIEVLRSPSSVFYGSDAIGGVIHIFTKKSVSQEGIGGRINLKYGTINQEKSLGFSLQGARGKTGYLMSFQGIDAESYSSPLEEVPQSQFTTASLFGKISHQSKKREIHLSFLGARGFNIGKPNRDSTTNPTWYPQENQNLFQLNWHEKEIGRGGELSFQFYLNPHFLETQKEKIDTSKKSYSRTQSFDLGCQISYGKRIGQGWRLKGGADFFGRFGAEAKNVITYFDSSGMVENSIEELPLTEGKRQDWGFFLSFDYSGIQNLDLVGGLRFDWLRMKANPGNSPHPEESYHRTWTGFLGTSAKLTEEIVAFINFSRAYRAPSLSERFYTGITGRGYAIGEPNLKPESSLNLDLGLKFIYRRYFAALYLFYYQIEDMIERYRSSEKIYTYGNIEKGQIQGLELEMEYFPIPGWKIFGNFYSFKGLSQLTKDPLNDIPTTRLYLGTRVWKGHFWGEINTSFQKEKKDQGPAEISIPGYEILNFQAGFFLSSSLRFYFSVSNLFNRTYVARPDPDSMEAPGRNFILGLNYSF